MVVREFHLRHYYDKFGDVFQGVGLQNEFRVLEGFGSV